MDAFTHAWIKTGREEGGYSDNAHDSGGPTMYGITQAVARAHGYLEEMRALPRERAREIAKSQYWDLMRLDDIARLSVPIAEELFDSGLNVGAALAGQWLQRCLNAATGGTDLIADGLIGALTVDALRSFLGQRKRPGEVVMLRALNGLQSAHYTALAGRREKDSAFWFGWQLNRVRIDL